MSDQMIFKRYEIKYMLTKEQRNLLQKTMSQHMIADVHGKSTILSLYLDTPDYLLIRRSIDKPDYKEKLRLRSYGVAKENTEVFFELKKKYDSVVYKRRESMLQKDLKKYLQTSIKPKDTQIMREIDFAMKRYTNIAPKVLLSYDREAFYGKNDHDFRMTFDDNILWRAEDLSLCSPIYGTPVLAPDQVLLEIKTAGSMPLWLVRFFSQNQIRPTSFSKYGTAYQTIMQSGNTYTNGGTYKYA